MKAMFRKQMMELIERTVDHMEKTCNNDTVEITFKAVNNNSIYQIQLNIHNVDNYLVLEEGTGQKTYKQEIFPLDPDLQAERYL